MTVQHMQRFDQWGGRAARTLAGSHAALRLRLLIDNYNVGFLFSSHISHQM